MHDGALVRYWDSKGQAFTYRVTSVFQQERTVTTTPGPPHLVFQTCANADGSYSSILAIVPAVFDVKSGTRLPLAVRPRAAG